MRKAKFTVDEMQEQIASLVEQRRQLSKQIHLLRTSVRGAKFRYPVENQHNHKNSKAYQLFGKRRKDLTPDELKEYNRVLQAQYRKCKQSAS